MVGATGVFDYWLFSWIGTAGDPQPISVIHFGAEAQLSPMDVTDREKETVAAAAAMQSRSTLAVIAALLGLGVFLVGMCYPARVTWPFEDDGARLSRVQRGVDPNTARWFELAQLPGIGESLARRIVGFRDQQAAAAGRSEPHVVFRRAADLVQVKGIGAKTVQRMGPFLRFNVSDG